MVNQCGEPIIMLVEKSAEWPVLNKVRNKLKQPKMIQNELKPSKTG